MDTVIPQYFLHNIPSGTISNTAHYYSECSFMCATSPDSSLEGAESDFLEQAFMTPIPEALTG